MTGISRGVTDDEILAYERGRPLSQAIRGVRFEKSLGKSDGFLRMSSSFLR